MVDEVVCGPAADELLLSNGSKKSYKSFQVELSFTVR